MARRRGSVALFVVLALLSAAVIDARPHEFQPGRRKYAVYNIGLTSVFTVASAIVQHQPRSARAVVKYLLIGSGAGFSFYEAKRIAGGGRTTEGWMLANAAASIVENTTSGEHPFGRIGYTVGPLRFRVATRLANHAIATIEADWSIAETISLVVARSKANHFRLRHGLIAIDRDSPWKTSSLQSGYFYGLTYGVFPELARGHNQHVWPHEMVHVIQDLQFDSVEPPVHTFGGRAEPSKPRSFFAFRHIRVGFSYLLNGPDFLRRYQRRWGEVEAYGLAQHTPVQP